VTEKNGGQQIAVGAKNEAQCCRADHKVDTDGNVERQRLQFNRYLFENFLSNVEAQIEYWIRKAKRETDPQVAQAGRLKAEGLGYALRLLNAFEPEFRELVECASRAAIDGTI